MKMPVLPGTVLPLGYLPQMQWVRDLQSFEGPLLSEFRSSRERFLYWWCDRDERHHRWLVMRAEARAVHRLTSGLLSMRRLIQDLPDGYVFVVDVDGEGEPRHVSMSPVGTLPHDYVPHVDKPLDRRLMVTDDTKFSIFLNGDLTLDDASVGPRRLIDAHALLSSFDATPKNPHQYPWRGGYSSVNFYSAVRAAQGTRRAQVDAMAFASPGYVEIRGSRAVALRVVAVVGRYRAAQQRIDAAMDRALTLIRHHHLNEVDSVLSVEDAQVLTGCGEAIMGALGEPTWAWILSTGGGNPYKAVKIAGSYYNRIRVLADLVSEGRLELPTM